MLGGSYLSFSANFWVDKRVHQFDKEGKSSAEMSATMYGKQSISHPYAI